jgi:hypothetical protein
VISILGSLMAIAAMGTQQYAGDHGKKVDLAVEKHVIATAASAHIKDGGNLPVTDDVLYQKKYITSKPTLASYIIDSDGTVIQIPRQ